jgi:hypothetical protein
LPDKIEYFKNTIGVKGVQANGSLGAAGTVLTSNGATTYWGPGGSDSNLDGGGPYSVYGGVLLDVDGGGI